MTMPVDVIEAERSRAKRLSPAERVRGLARLGPVVRLRTGIPSLDRDTRGGLPTPRLVVLGGAPGAGKTSLATWLAWTWARTGVPVVALAVDEGPEGVLSRVGQLEGLSPDALDERAPLTLERLARTLDATPFDVVDGDDEAGTVEGAVATLVAMPSSGPRVLVVDSIQTVRARGTDRAESPRERVDLVVRALKRARDEHGLLILATCELARGAYRSRSVAETINDLAAFKESGGIEYAAQTAFVLRSVPDEASLVDVTVPKNRACRREPFRLAMDHRTTAFHEVDLPPASSARPKVSIASALEADARLVFRVVLTKQPVKGVDALCDEVRADGHALGSPRIRAALTYLKNRGAVEDRPEKGKPRLYARADAYRDPQAQEGGDDAA